MEAEIPAVSLPADRASSRNTPVRCGFSCFRRSMRFGELRGNRARLPAVLRREGGKTAEIPPVVRSTSYSLPGNATRAIDPRGLGIRAITKSVAK